MAEKFWVRLMHLGPAVMLVLAPMKWPYEYYGFLRLIVFVAAGIAALINYESRKLWAYTFIAVAFLFNPFIPVHLTRAMWLPIDIAVAVLFVWHWITIERESSRAT